jgi:serine-type D-Ala-D-Ala carboxypeptidase/endopeptidase
MRPLGMNASGYEIADVPPGQLATGYRWENNAFVKESSTANGVFGAMGGVHTSANDYARWVAFLLSAWPARDDAETGPLTRPVVRELAIGTSFPRLGNRRGPNGMRLFHRVWGGLQRRTRLRSRFGLDPQCGYPGYGSTVLLMPEYGVGIFAFVNRTYDAPTGVVFEAAGLLKQRGLLKSQAIPVDEPLARSYEGAAAMYRAGEMKAASNYLAVNFLMDRSADNRSREFEKLKSASAIVTHRNPSLRLAAGPGLLPSAAPTVRYEVPSNFRRPTRRLFRLSLSRGYRLAGS